MANKFALAPISVGSAIVAGLIAWFALGLSGVLTAAIALGAAGIVSWFMGGKQATRMGPILLVLALVVGFAGPPTIAAIGGQSASEDEVSAYSFDTTPSTVTAGTSLSGNTITVPETYNSTDNTVDLDPVTVAYTVVRTDKGTSDAAFEVAVSVPPKVIDQSTGLEHNVVELDSGEPDIRIIDQSANETDGIRGLSRTFPLEFGDSSKEVRVRYNLNPSAFGAVELYEALTSSVSIEGASYSVVFQTVEEVS